MMVGDADTGVDCATTDSPVMVTSATAIAVDPNLPAPNFRTVPTVISSSATRRVEFTRALPQFSPENGRTLCGDSTTQRIDGSDLQTGTLFPGNPDAVPRCLGTASALVLASSRACGRLSLRVR